MTTKDKDTLVQLLDEVQSSRDPSRLLDTKLDFFLGDYRERFKDVEGNKPRLRASGEFIEVHHNDAPPVYLKVGNRTGNLHESLELFNQVWKSEDHLRYYVTLNTGDEPSARVMYRMNDWQDGMTYIGSLNEAPVPGPTLERAVMAATIESLLETQDTVRSAQLH